MYLKVIVDIIDYVQKEEIIMGLIIAVVVVVLIVLYTIATYNGLVKSKISALLHGHRLMFN